MSHWRVLRVWRCVEAPTAVEAINVAAQGEHDSMHVSRINEPPVVSLRVPDHLAEIRKRIADPGSFTPRGDNYQETIPSWGARAVWMYVQQAFRDEPV